MPTDAATNRQRLPRRGRYLIPAATPWRAELVAALGVLAVLAHLVFAQLTIVLAAVFYAITKATRWRPQWLAIPAAAGVTWTLAGRPASALDGFVAGPRQIVAYLSGVGADPVRIAHLGAAFRGLDGWLPRQLPLALAAAAAEAAAAAWLSWLHTDEWRRAAPRPGAVIAARRWYLARVVRAGGVVTRDGACLGIDSAGGRRAALSWDEVAPGVLCAGAGGSGTTATSFQLVHAAIRRRKPVIAVDLSGSRQLAEWFAIACRATDTPLQVFAAAGGAYYEPLRNGDPGRRAALVMGMIDWAGTADQYRRSCGAYLNDMFTVLDAAPGDPRVPVLDEVLHLLNPAALRARADCVPRFTPHREKLVERVKVSASLCEADPQTLSALAGQLAELRSSPLGRWLAPPPAAGGAGPATPATRQQVTRVDLGRAVRRRGVVLFSLDKDARCKAAAAVASLVAQDVMAICAELRRIGVGGDGLVWFEQCGDVPVAVLTELVERGAGAGMPALLTTTSARVADKLSGLVNALLIHRMTDPVMAERFARVTGEKLVPAGPAASPAHGRMMAASAPAGATAMLAAHDPRAASARGGRPLPAVGYEPGYDAGCDPAYPAASSAAFRSGPAFVRRTVVSPETLCCLGDGEFALVVRAPRRRFVPLGKTVPARLDAPSRRRPSASAAAHVPVTGAGAAAHQGPSHPRQPFGGVTGPPGPAGDPHAADAPQLPMDARGAAKERRPVPRHASLTGAVHGESAEQRRWPT